MINLANESTDSHNKEQYQCSKYRNQICFDQILDINEFVN